MYDRAEHEGEHWIQLSLKGQDRPASDAIALSVRMPKCPLIFGGRFDSLGLTTGPTNLCVDKQIQHPFSTEMRRNHHVLSFTIVWLVPRSLQFDLVAS